MQETYDVDDELEALAATVAAKVEAEKERQESAPRGTGKHLGGMNREQYRKARRTWGHVHGGKHPVGKLTSRRARLVNRMRSRAVAPEPVSRSAISGANKLIRAAGVKP